MGISKSNLAHTGISAFKQRSQQRGDLLEFSVVYTDRAVNLMSKPFQQVMKDISSILKETYNTKHAALIPGSGTSAMEAVAREFATNKKVLIIRNGFFSFRWSDILAVCGITNHEVVLKAEFDSTEVLPQFSPINIEQALESINTNKPDCVFLPQVETATGILTPDFYIKQLSEAVHSYGGLLIVDAIAAGTLWLNMGELGVDVLISAPQKGWSGPACCGFVLLSEKAYEIAKSEEKEVKGSFALSLKKWLNVMEAYEKGGFMYYCTLPTDALSEVRDNMKDTVLFGTEKAKEAATRLGEEVRLLLSEEGFKSVALNIFSSPTVIVSYLNEKLTNRQANIVEEFKKNGLQVATGVPFKCGESEELASKTFRIGLFGLDKLKDTKTVIDNLRKAIKQINTN